MQRLPRAGARATLHTRHRHIAHEQRVRLAAGEQGAVVRRLPVAGYAVGVEQPAPPPLDFCLGVEDGMCREYAIPQPEVGERQRAAGRRRAEGHQLAGMMSGVKIARRPIGAGVEFCLADLEPGTEEDGAAGMDIRPAHAEESLARADHAAAGVVP